MIQYHQLIFAGIKVAGFQHIVTLEGMETSVRIRAPQVVGALGMAKARVNVIYLHPQELAQQDHTAREATSLHQPIK